jgi:exonuclease SbcC
MIPQRVKLRGFLCYKEEQSIEFDGNATLWMLSGLNGSGKSAIFDAVTYALFGHHRGGGTGAVELINKESDTLLVEFDFLLDGRLNRAKRTLKRDTKGGARGTQQMFRYENDTWVAIPDTGQKREFDAWVEENIGLSYETFTSSVLLLQGKAERLLDSKPEGRREVLASIVDLGRYERLHQKADERRKSLEGEWKALAGRIAALPVVAPLELQEARSRIEDAELARSQARNEVERLQGFEYQARVWQDMQARLTQARTRWQKARAVLADASAIEQAVERLRELREVLPRLNDIVVQRGQANQAEEHIRFQEREREKHVAALSQKDNALRQARDKRTTLLGQIARDEAKHRDMAAHLRKSSEQLVTLREVERLESDVARLRDELSRLPADPLALVSLARESCERLDAIDRQMPILSRFATRRNDLGKALAQEKASEQTLQVVRTRGEACKAETEQLRPRVEEASRAFQAASDQSTEARTLLAQAKESLNELLQLGGAKVCRHCGQTLTEGHLDEEKRRRSQAVKQAESRAKQTVTALESARKTEVGLREQLQGAEQAYQEAREEYRDHHRQLVSAKGAVEKLQEECAHIWSELAEGYRFQISKTTVADWLSTSYPTDRDLEGLRVQLRELELARRKVREAEKVQQSWSQLKAQEIQALENLTRLLRDLPTDRQALRREHANLEAQEKALFKSVDACRHQVSETEKEVDRLTRERDQVQTELTRTDTRLKEQQLVQQNAERNLAAQLKALPATWQAQAASVGIRDMHTLMGEQKHLEEEGTDERGRELEHARHNLSVLEQDVKQLEKQESSFPPEAREDLTVLASKVRAARSLDRDRDEQLAQARQHLALLESYQQQRQQLDREYRALEAELQSHRLLSELLGKDRLQLYLVRQAERQVVEYANAVLDRLSGGQLYLKLSGEANGEGASAKALDLEAFNRATGERPINVAFLSGSQKFRVAVSLALGIGQYASKQHRPIESVIIDEGFGCLDSQGRQVMIQELQNLRSQMRCILLVSHQEDFAESFSDGYQFRLENGATRVARFQK